MVERGIRLVPLTPELKAGYDPNDLLYLLLRRAIRYSQPDEVILVAKCPSSNWSGLAAGSKFNAQIGALQKEHVDFCAEGHEIAVTLVHLNQDKIDGAVTLARGAIHHLDYLVGRLRREQKENSESQELREWLEGEGKPIRHLYNK